MPHTAAARMATRDRDAGRYQRNRPEQTLFYQIVEQHYPAFTAHLAERGNGNKAKVSDEPQTPAERWAAMSWVQRLKRVFNIDIETCRECAAAVKVIACIEDPVVIQKILNYLKGKAEPQEPNRLPESRAPPQATLFD
jgi:hypothetical protein